MKSKKPINKAASLLGKKGAATNLKKGKKYFSDLAKKRWSKTKATV